MAPRIRRPSFNLNTVLAVLTILGMVFGAFKYLMPIASVPEKVEKIDLSVQAVRRDVDEVSKVQAVQTDVLQRMATIAEQSSQMRREVDVTRAEISEIKRRLELLEESRREK